MDKILEEYEDFIKRYKNSIGEDINLEKDIEKVLLLLIKQKILISMLKDTITHVTKTVENIFPQPYEIYMDSLKHYEESIYKIVDKIRGLMFDDYPNLRDIIEDIELEYTDLEIKLREKNLIL